MKRIIKIAVICIICTVITPVMAGYTETEGRDLLAKEALEQGQTIEWDPEKPLTGNEIINLQTIIDQHLLNYEYKINTEKGSEVYVCSHYGYDMAQALIDDEYDAGIVCDHTNDHVLIWLNLNGQRYVIEPQNGEYWLSNLYNLKHNIDYVSLTKGKEFAKESSEGLHR